MLAVSLSQIGICSAVFNVQATNAATVYGLNTGSGSNTINLGSTAPTVGGIVDGIQGLLNIDGSGTDTLNVDDTGSTLGKTGTLTPTALTGLGLGANGITYSGIATLNLSLGSGNNTLLITNTSAQTTTINGGNGNDTFNVNGTAGTLNLNGGAGNNIFNFGSLAPATGGVLRTLVGAIYVTGGTGSNVINVDDTGDTLSVVGTLTSSNLSGLGLGGGLNYTLISALNINLLSGYGVFNVQSTNASTVTTLNTGAGTKTVNVGSLAPVLGGTVTGIQGALIIIGSGNDTLNVDNTGGTTNQTGTLTATTLTGLGMGAHGIIYSGLAVLNVTLGSGNDTFTINGVNTSTVTTIDGGLGSNTAIINITGNFTGINFTLLNFNTTSINVSGDFTGTLNDSGAITTVTIGGSLTSTGVINAGSIGSMTVGVDLAGLLNVTGLLGTLTVDGGTPGKIEAGSINVITVLAGYGNRVLDVTEGGIERQILATPVNGGNLPATIHFAFVYDSETGTTPQLAIQITDTHPVARSFNLALVVVNSATAKFDLSLVDSLANGHTGISNITLQGDILTKLTAPELALFTNLTATSRAGVVLPADSITAVEVSGILPIGFIDVAGIEGLAFAIITTATGTVVNVSTPLGSSNNPQSLWNLLGSTPVIDSATDSFVVIFNQTQSVRLFANDNNTDEISQIMTLTAETTGNLPVTATIKILPSSTVNPLVQSISLVGDGGSINSLLSIANITSAGSLGDVTISASAGSTVNNAAGLGNVTATNIFGSINVANAGIYGVVQSTVGNIGQTILGSSGAISSVSTIFANGALTGQIISAGSLISSVKTNGTFSGVIAAQGNIGVIQYNPAGNAVTSTSGALSRFGGITTGNNNSGQIIALGNIYGDLNFGGTMTGRVAADGVAINGLSAARLGILGNISVNNFAAGSAIVSGGLVGDAAGSTNVYLGSPKGFVAALGGVTLRSTTLPAGDLIQNISSGANLTAVNAIFTNGNLPLTFNTGGNLQGLILIETDLASLRDTGGTLSGTVV